MKASETIALVLEMWPQLPRFAGDQWYRLCWQIYGLLSEYEAASSELDREQVASSLLELLSHIPAVAAEVRQVMSSAQWAWVDDGASAGRQIVASNAELDAELSALLRAPLRTRYIDALCPEKVWVQTPRVALVVRLTIQPTTSGETASEMNLRLGFPVRLHAQSDGFQVLGRREQIVEIMDDIDSEPVVFYLRPLRVGHTDIVMDVFQGSDLLRTVTLPVEITPFEVVVREFSRPSGSLTLEDRATPPDIVLHISWLAERSALEHTLITDGGASWKTFRPVEIVGGPVEYTKQLFLRISRLLEMTDPTAQSVLHKRRVIAPDDVDRRLKLLGQSLWRELIPQEFKALYTEKRASWHDRTLLVLSDEPYFPWELLWPYSSGHWEDEGPWCVTLRMTRWLRRDDQGNGNETPPTTLRLTSFAVLAPQYSALPNLAAAQDERNVISDMMLRHGVQDVSPVVPEWGSIMDLLEDGGYDWMHVASHGNFFPEQPDGESALWLERDASLTPEAIVGPRIEGHIEASRPAFFLNACQAGRQGWGITRIGGWANRFVSVGAGLFVGPMWEVSDAGALKFARAFYRGLLNGETVAVAARAGRAATRLAGDPTWLAYSVFAHPNARVSTSQLSRPASKCSEGPG